MGSFRWRLLNKNGQCIRLSLFRCLGRVRLKAILETRDWIASSKLMLCFKTVVQIHCARTHNASDIALYLRTIALLLTLEKVLLNIYTNVFGFFVAKRPRNIPIGFWFDKFVTIKVVTSIQAILSCLREVVTSFETIFSALISLANVNGLNTSGIVEFYIVNTHRAL